MESDFCNNAPLRRKRDGLVPMEEVFNSRGGAVKKTLQPAPRRFTTSPAWTKWTQLVGAREADSDLGFMACRAVTRSDRQALADTKRLALGAKPHANGDIPRTPQH